MVVNGKDLFAVLPTGYGKTVLYSILPKLLWETKVKVRFPADCDQGRIYVPAVIEVLRLWW